MGEFGGITDTTFSLMREQFDISNSSWLLLNSVELKPHLIQEIEPEEMDTEPEEPIDGADVEMKEQNVPIDPIS